FRLALLALADRHRSPEVVEQRLAMGAPLLLAPFFRAQVHRALAGIAVDAVALQRMGGVDQTLDIFKSVALLALGDVAFCEGEIVGDARSVGPLLEDIVVLEE